MTFDHLTIETTPEGVRTITLNRPDKLNAVNMKLAAEVPAALRDASTDDAVRVVVLTGAGRGFCAGLELSPDNLKEFRDSQAVTRHASLDDLQWVGHWVLAATACDKPVIAAINGPAAGAGFGLALAADIRIMSEAAVLTAGYARIGLSPDAGVSYLLPRIVGTSRAAELILTARDIKADEAERIGLVSRVVAPEAFAATIAETASRLAAGPPVALTMTKRLLVSGPDTDLVSHLRNEWSSIQKCLATRDFADAVQAFAEKRKPVFTGR